MLRINENTIQITQEELTTLEFFIDETLDRMWDNYTDNYICTDSWEEGKRQMNPTLYNILILIRNL
mgnify:FL=1|jgi:hypothetical protein